MIRVFVALIALFVFSTTPISSAKTDHAKQLPKIFNLLENGNSKDKKRALLGLWFLKYSKYRRDIKVWDPILKALKDKDPTVREAAAASFKSIGNGMLHQKSGTTYMCCTKTAIVPSLIEALKDDIPRVRIEAAKALGMYKAEKRDKYTLIEEERGIEPLIKALKDNNPWVRLNAAWALGETGDIKLKAAMPLLEQLKDDSDWRYKYVQQEALIAFGKLELGRLDLKLRPKALEILIRRVNDPYFRLLIIKILGQLQAYEAVDIFLKAKNDPDENIRSQAMKILSKNNLRELKMINYPGGGVAWKLINRPIDKKEVLELFANKLKDPSPSVRAKAVLGLGKSRNPEAVSLLLEALNDNSDEVKLNVLKHLGNFKDDRIIDAILSFIELNLLGEAEKVFKDIVKKSAVKKVYIYRKNGIRNVVENRKLAPKGTVFSSSGYIHPEIVSKVIERARNNFLGVANILYLF